MNFRETIDRVIDLARQVNDYYDVELPKYHPRYPFIDPAAAGPPRPRAQDELKELIEALPPVPSPA